MIDRNSSPPSPLPRVIGLTGGVGMGKTTVSNYLAETYQIPVLDADLLARQAVEPGSPGLQKIVERYGAQVLRDQSLDRSRLGEIIFSNPAERLWLEQLIHPIVRDRLQAGLADLANQHYTTAVLAIPLLFESKMTDLVTEIWVVYTPLERQIDRIQQRDRLSFEQINSRIDSQMPIDQKIDRADRVLDNSSTLEALLDQIDTALGQAEVARSTTSIDLN
jgi:dephospho-CoA kinase